MGDFFFKYAPALLSARPDVSFIPLMPQQYQYVMVMATDGLWDHMAHQDKTIQHRMITDYVQSTMQHARGDYYVLAPAELHPSGSGEEQVSEVSSAVNESTLAELVRDHSGTCLRGEGDEDDGDDDEDDDDDAMELTANTTVNKQADDTTTSSTMQAKLHQVCIMAHGLADREMTTCPSRLYNRGYLRYDDVTVFAVFIEGTQQ